MNLFTTDWLAKKITFKPSEPGIQSAWKIRYGGSNFLVAEGPSNTSRFGRDVFTVLAMGREINQDDPMLWVCEPKREA